MPRPNRIGSNTFTFQYGYSKTVISTAKKLETATFTFQYGYSKTPSVTHSVTTSAIFTFQYGYSQTKNFLIIDDHLEKFTFQYGYSKTCLCSCALSSMLTGFIKLNIYSKSLYVASLVIFNMFHQDNIILN